MISKILSAAIKLWLRTQVDRLDELEVEITGGDRQILGGYIPGVFLASSCAIYQGLHLRQIQLTGENIRVNLRQVLKGKPLRLLEPVPVRGNVLLEETDLKASLTSPLLSGALTDLLLILLKANGFDDPNKILKNYQPSWQQVTLNTDKLCIRGTLTDVDRVDCPIMIRTGIGLANTHTLHLYPVQIESSAGWINVICDRFEIDLGEEVELEEVSLTEGKLFCCGGLRVLP